MKYIYDDLRQRYNAYKTNTSKNTLRRFRQDIDEMAGESEEESEFLKYYRAKMPVGTHDCVMNIICRQIEKEFDGFAGKCPKGFDPSIYKCGVDYDFHTYYLIRNEIEQCLTKIRNAAAEAGDPAEIGEARRMIIEDSRLHCLQICASDWELCDILIDICYEKDSTKQLVWDIAGQTIIDNLLDKNGRIISYPVRDDDGDVMFNGEKFTYDTRYVVYFEESDTEREEIRGRDTDDEAE